MAYEPRRTLLVGLSALAVVLTAALFPAAGFGTHPGGSVSLPVATEAPSTPEPATPTPDRAETPADTPSPAPDDPDDGGIGPLLPGLFEALAAAAGRLWLLALAGTGLAGVAVLARGVEPGSPHVELPFGYTVTLPFAVPAWVGSFGTRVARLTMGFVVAVSTSVTQLLDAVAAALAAVSSGLGITLGEGLRGTLALAGRLPAALASALQGALRLPAGLLSLPAALSTASGSVAGATDRPEDDARATAPAPAPDEDAEDAGPPGVEEAWLAMVELLPVERSPSTTPREFASLAVDRGVPAAPVERLTDAFEDVVYGGLAADERASSAREALASLRERLGGGR